MRILNTRENYTGYATFVIEIYGCYIVLFTDENGPDFFINIFIIFMCFIWWIFYVYLLLYFLLNLHWTIYVLYRILYLQPVRDTIVLSKMD
jgi:hypothetical protein